jgi:hypothetical protein
MGHSKYIRFAAVSGPFVVGEGAAAVVMVVL